MGSLKMHDLLLSVFSIYFIGGCLAIVKALHFEEVISYQDQGFPSQSAYNHYRFLWKPLFWPIFLIIRNPAHVFSETFFKHYGDDCIVYQKSSGLINFLRDVFQGKDRYKNYTYGCVATIISPDAPILKDVKDQITCRLYATIIYGVCGEKHLLMIIINPRNLTEYLEASRFMLDRCTCYSQEDFYKELTGISDDVPRWIEQALKRNGT